MGTSQLGLCEASGAVVVAEIRDFLIVYSGDNEIHSLKYHLISGDLRQMELTGSKILSSGVHTRWV